VRPSNYGRRSTVRTCPPTPWTLHQHAQDAAVIDGIPPKHDSTIHSTSGRSVLILTNRWIDEGGRPEEEACMRACRARRGQGGSMLRSANLVQQRLDVLSGRLNNKQRQVRSDLAGKLRVQVRKTLIRHWETSRPAAPWSMPARRLSWAISLNNNSWTSGTEIGFGSSAERAPRGPTLSVSNVPITELGPRQRRSRWVACQLGVVA